MRGNGRPLRKTVTRHHTMYYVAITTRLTKHIARKPGVVEVEGSSSSFYSRGAYTSAVTGYYLV